MPPKAKSMATPSTELPVMISDGKRSRPLWKDGDGDGDSSAHILERSLNIQRGHPTWKVFMGDVPFEVKRNNEPPHYVYLDDYAAYHVYSAIATGAYDKDDAARYWPFDFNRQGIKLDRKNRGRAAYADDMCTEYAKAPRRGKLPMYEFCGDPVVAATCQPVRMQHRRDRMERNSMEEAEEADAGGEDVADVLRKPPPQPIDTNHSNAPVLSEAMESAMTGHPPLARDAPVSVPATSVRPHDLIEGCKNRLPETPTSVRSSSNAVPHIVQGDMPSFSQSPVPFTATSNTPVNWTDHPIRDSPREIPQTATRTMNCTNESGLIGSPSISGKRNYAQVDLDAHEHQGQGQESRMWNPSLIPRGLGSEADGPASKRLRITDGSSFPSENPLPPPVAVNANDDSASGKSKGQIMVLPEDNDHDEQYKFHQLRIHDLEATAKRVILERNRAQARGQEQSKWNRELRKTLELRENELETLKADLETERQISRHETAVKEALQHAFVLEVSLKQEQIHELRESVTNLQQLSNEFDDLGKRVHDMSQTASEQVAPSAELADGLWSVLDSVQKYLHGIGMDEEWNEILYKAKKTQLKISNEGLQS